MENIIAQFELIQMRLHLEFTVLAKLGEPLVLNSAAYYRCRHNRPPYSNPQDHYRLYNKNHRRTPNYTSHCRCRSGRRMVCRNLRGRRRPESYRERHHLDRQGL